MLLLPEIQQGSFISEDCLSFYVQMSPSSVPLADIDVGTNPIWISVGERSVFETGQRLTLYKTN